MSGMLRKIAAVSGIIFGVAAALYPLLVFYFLVVKKIPVRQISLFVMAFALVVFIAGTSKKKA
jgi:hypothetical protein